MRNLNIREFALPFDWIVSSISSIQECIEDHFEKFHTNLQFNHNNTRLIDEYGFQFPHDYPLSDMSNNIIDNIGEGIFGEENGKYICDNWRNYHNAVKDKYNRRIERFLKIINEQKPIIVLCRYNTMDVIQLQQLFVKHYNTDFYFINSSSEFFENDKIKNINTEQNGMWNETEIWEQNIKTFIQSNNCYTNTTPIFVET